MIYTLGKEPTVLERLPQKSDNPQRAALGLEKIHFNRKKPPDEHGGSAICFEWLQVRRKRKEGRVYRETGQNNLWEGENKI